MNHCIDCKKEITYNAIRCSSCAAKERITRNGPPNLGKKHPGMNSGEKNGGFIDGRCSKKYFCKNCNKQISYTTMYYGQHRCPSCSMREKMKYPEMIKIAVKNLPKNTFGENNGNWQSGISKLPYSIEFTEELKEQIRKRDNYTCQNCSMTEEEHLIVIGTNLIIHHIDYNKMNCQNDNLITLCNQCNGRANFNRSYWKEFYQKKLIGKELQNE